MSINEMIKMFEGLVNYEETEKFKSEIGTFKEDDPRYKILEEISTLGFTAQSLIADMGDLRNDSPDLMETKGDIEESIKYDAQTIIDFLKNPQGYLLP